MNSETVSVINSNLGSGRLSLIDDSSTSKHVWIGDFPPGGSNMLPNGVWPSPAPIRVLPDATHPIGGLYNINCVDWSSYISYGPTSAWRVSVTGTGIKLCLDVPGMRVADVVLEIENGTVKVTGARADTNVPIYQTHFIGTDYDPKTADAVVELGVLTVNIGRFREKTSHKVPVSAR